MRIAILLLLAASVAVFLVQHHLKNATPGVHGRAINCDGPVACVDAGLDRARLLDQAEKEGWGSTGGMTDVTPMLSRLANAAKRHSEQVDGAEDAADSATEEADIAVDSIDVAGMLRSGAPASLLGVEINGVPSRFMVTSRDEWADGIKETVRLLAVAGERGEKVLLVLYYPAMSGFDVPKDRIGEPGFRVALRLNGQVWKTGYERAYQGMPWTISRTKNPCTRATTQAAIPGCHVASLTVDVLSALEMKPAARGSKPLFQTIRIRPVPVPVAMIDTAGA